MGRGVTSPEEEMMLTYPDFELLPIASAASLIVLAACEACGRQDCRLRSPEHDGMGERSVVVYLS